MFQSNLDICSDSVRKQNTFKPNIMKYKHVDYIICNFCIFLFLFLKYISLSSIVLYDHLMGYSEFLKGNFLKPYQQRN